MNQFVVSVLLLVVCIGITKSSFTVQQTTEHIADECYYCSICPKPFRPDDDYVTRTPSATGWCITVGITNDTDSDYQLAVAYPGLCQEDGCDWMLVDENLKWACCCSQHLCNTGIPLPTTTTISAPTPANTTTTYNGDASALKSIIAVLIGALMMLIIARKNI